MAGRDARLLVLGTLPGPESLRQRQYYALPRNAFWPIMGELIGARPELPYARRLEVLVERRIALWDVCGAARRIGALDASIHRASVEPNDFAGFLARHRGIDLICFNGQTAAKLYRQLVLAGLPEPLRGIAQQVLPSTSPAHAAMPFGQKLACWRSALEAGPGR